MLSLKVQQALPNIKTFSSFLPAVQKFKYGLVTRLAYAPIIVHAFNSRRFLHNLKVIISVGKETKNKRNHFCSHFCFLGKNISTCSCVFGFFGGFLHVFLMYSCSKSFRELKSAIKNQFFLYLGGLGAKLSF